MIPLSDPDLTRRSWPYVTIAIIAVNAVVFVYEFFLDPVQQAVFFYRWGLIPAELQTGTEFHQLVAGSSTYDITSPVPPWGTVFSSMFIHGGFLHLIGNMLYLWVFGDNIEDRFGHLKFLLFFLAAGVAAAWTQVLLSLGSETPMIGASGAVAGVLGTYIWFYPKSRIRTLTTFPFFTVIQVPAVVLLGFWFVLQFFSGVGSLGSGSAFSEGVAYWAHVGGFAAGLVVAIVYAKVAGWSGSGRPREDRQG